MLRTASFQEILILLPALLVALTIHELSHGFMAYMLGDPTAKRDGRLSLNPIRHIDPIGLIMILVVGFGWAKPVMVDPGNLKNPKVDMALISIVGPLSNFLIAFIGLMILHPLVFFGSLPDYVINALTTFCWINIILGIFNLIPIPPLDGSKVVAGILPNSVYNSLPPVGRFSSVILLILVLTGFIGRFLLPAAETVFTLFIQGVFNFYGLFMN